jgi:molecular chaperone DnaK (HSP70)
MQQYPSRTALQYETGEECEKLVTEYLRNLRKHVEGNIRKKLTEPVWKNNGPPHYIITVPAVWDPKAWDTTRSCAEKAGMGKDVQIITEPEAAGIYALKNIAQPLKKDDTFVMCDAGGG